METFTLEQHVMALSDYLPNGRMFEAKGISGSNLHQLITGISGELFNAQGFIKTLNDEFIPDLTNLFLSEWESALGIPDSCFDGTGTNDKRRSEILIKLASQGVQTTQDFVNLALMFGITVTVESGTDSHLVFATVRDARFTIVVTFSGAAVGVFPYKFPFVFGGTGLVVVECLFNKLKPANCQVIFNQV